MIVMVKVHDLCEIPGSWDVFAAPFFFTKYAVFGICLLFFFWGADICSYIFHFKSLGLPF